MEMISIISKSYSKKTYQENKTENGRDKNLLHIFNFDH